VVNGADDRLIGSAMREADRPSRDGWGARILLGAADIGRASFDVEVKKRGILENAPHPSQEYAVWVWRKCENLHPFPGISYRADVLHKVKENVVAQKKFVVFRSKYDCFTNGARVCELGAAMLLWPYKKNIFWQRQVF
jgi:hypothetical protein